MYVESTANELSQTSHIVDLRYVLILIKAQEKCLAEVYITILNAMLIYHDKLNFFRTFSMILST